MANISQSSTNADLRSVDRAPASGEQDPEQLRRTAFLIYDVISEIEDGSMITASGNPAHQAEKPASEHGSAGEANSAQDDPVPSSAATIVEDHPSDQTDDSALPSGVPRTHAEDLLRSFGHMGINRRSLLTYLEPDHLQGYTLIRRIGRGGTGTVWQAQASHDHSTVAIKFLDPRRMVSSLAQQRVQRELRLTVMLDHPNLARLRSHGHSGGLFYYIMDLVQGPTLDRYVHETKPEPEQVVRLMLQVCQAVDYTHRCGVIHRDLKPSNVIVDGSGVPRLIDFGLAKSYVNGAENMTLSTEGQVSGTPGFMSPEQASGRVHQVDPRTDVYGLGAMLFKLLTGRYVHDPSGQMHEIVRRVIEEEPSKLREIRPDLSPDLEAIISRALRSHPDDRYLGVTQLVQDLERFLNGQPIKAYTLGRKHRRTWAEFFHTYRVVFPIILLLLLLNLATIGFMFGMYWESMEENSANRDRVEVLRERLDGMMQLLNERRAREADEAASAPSAPPAEGHQPEE